MAVISSPTYEPKTTAENLANAYIAPTQTVLDAQTKKATATESALGTLSSALTAFQSSLASLAGSTTTVASNSATVSNTAVASATASANAVAGTYSFYVQQLATAGQVSYDVGTSNATGAGALTVSLADGTNFQIDLANADSDKDNKLSAKEIAAAINVAASNNSRVTASTLTVNGQQKLVLTSTKTGADNAVASLDVSGLGDADLQTALSAPTVMTKAQNAIVNIGGKDGTAVEQASNTFSVYDDIKFTAKQAQGASDAAVTLTVAADSSTTTSNVQSFVTAYNTLLGVFKTLTAAGDHTAASSTSSAPTTEDAAFYNDAGVASLRSRIDSALRNVTGGQSLISFGISAGRDGTLSVDSSRLNKAVAANPGKLDTLFGSTTSGTGVLGTINKLVGTWTNSTNGLITSRKDAVSKQQTDIATRQATLRTQFDSAYSRYLAQFTKLQELQSTMTNTSNLFTALFSSDSSS